MPAFHHYDNVENLREQIRQWATAELPVARHPHHYVQVRNFRFRVQIAASDGWTRVHVDEAPLWRMTARQLCNAVWRALRACLAPVACRAAKLRKEIVAGIEGAVPPGVAYADGKWWTASSVSHRWLCRLGQSMRRGEGATAPDNISAVPDFAGMRIDEAQFEAMAVRIDALIHERDWDGVTWPDIEAILMLLYSIDAANNHSNVTARRDRMFVELFGMATRRLGLGLDTAQRLMAAMDRLPPQAEPCGAVLREARSLWFAAAYYAANSFLSGCDSGVTLPKVDDRFHEWAKSTDRTCEPGFGLVRATELLALGARLVQWASDGRKGQGSQDAAGIARVLPRIVASPLWSEEQRAQLSRALPIGVPVAAVDGKPEAFADTSEPVSMRCWGRPSPMRKSPRAACVGSATASL